MATRPSQEDSPFSHPYPLPIPLSPSCIVYPKGGHLQGPHRPTIYRAFFISVLFFPLEFGGEPALLCTSLCLLGILLRVVLSAITALPNALDTVYKGVSPFSHFIPLPMLIMKPRVFTSSLTRVSGYLVLAERPRVFSIR